MTDDELTREEAVALADDLGNQLYRAEDRLAFVREMLAGRTEPVAPATVLAWLDHQHCSRVESEQQQIKRLTARVAELEQDQAAAVTSHTFEGELGQPCHAGAFGEFCGAAWEQHQMRLDDSRLLEVADPKVKVETSSAWTTPDNPPTSTNAVDNPREAQS